MDFLFGADMPLAVRFFFAFVIVLALIGGTAFLVRRFGGERLGASSSRGRQPRLAVIDAAAVDGRRRLILIRRDNVEHLLMIGGPSDVVVEANIVRAAASARDAAGPRSTAPAEALPRPVPINEGNMWPLQPEPAPAAAPRRVSRAPPRQQPMQWTSRRRWHCRAGTADRRWIRRGAPRCVRSRAPRCARSRARRCAPSRASRARPEPRTADPLAGLARRARARAMPNRRRSHAPSHAAKRRANVTARAGPRAAAASGRPSVCVRRRRPPAAADEPMTRGQCRPESRRDGAAPGSGLAPSEAGRAARAPEAASRPAMSAPAAPEPMMEPDPVPTMAEPAAADEDAPPAAAPQPAPRARRGEARPQKSVYDSLEQEMASLLGRPNSKA